jgi:hypothetical protein
MVWRTAGSLVGALCQVAALKQLSIHDALYACPVMTAALVVPLAFLRYTASPHHAAYVVMSVGERWRGTVQRLTAECSSVVGALKKTARRPEERATFVGFVCVLAFVFVYNLAPDAGVMYSQYIAMNFDFEPWELSAISAVGLVGSICGGEFYGRVLAQRNQFAIFAVGCVCSALCCVTRIAVATHFSADTLHVPNAYFIPFDTFVVAVLGRIAYMPVLHVASERAPVGFESFVFELFTAAAIGGSTVAAIATTAISNQLGITAYRWGNLVWLLAICAAAKLLPLLFAAALPRKHAIVSDRLTVEDRDDASDSASAVA